MKWILRGSNSCVVSYWKNPLVLARIHAISKEIDLLQGINESYQLFITLKNTEKIDGDVAEVGVYTGGTARIIAENKGNRKLYLFDAFDEGLPEPVFLHGGILFNTNQLNASFEKVQKYFENMPDVFIHKGIFPESSRSIKDKKFSFVHLDVDLYKGTKDCLEFFYPRMNKGGVILSHDYGTLAGVQQAFDEFFADKPEPLIEMSGSQVLVVKCPL